MKLIKRPIFIILLLALVIRLAGAFILGNKVSGLSGAWDEISYSLLGQQFAQGHGLTFPTDWYPWIKSGAPQSYYSAALSLFLGGIYIIFGYHPIIARIIMSFLGVLVVAMIYLLSKKLFTEKVALVSALIAALYAYLIFYSITLVTETPFILGILGVIYLTYEISENPRPFTWFVLGIMLAITVLFRMAVIFFIPVLLIYFWLHLPRQKRLWLITPVIIVCLFVFPFTLRNYLTWHRFLLLESQFGHVFWNGNYPGRQGKFTNEVFPIPGNILATNNDAEITNRLLKLGLQNVIHDPKQFFRLTISRLLVFFEFWPSSDSTFMANLMRVASFGIMLPFALVGLWMTRKSWRKLIPVYLFMIIHTGIYAISWTMIRYRIPLDAFLISFAAFAIIAILERFNYRLPFAKLPE